MGKIGPLPVGESPGKQNASMHRRRNVDQGARWGIIGCGDVVQRKGGEHVEKITGEAVRFDTNTIYTNIQPHFKEGM